jgi:hypothetical protein
VLNEFLRLKNYQVTIIDKLSECSLVWFSSIFGYF